MQYDCNIYFSLFPRSMRGNEGQGYMYHEASQRKKRKK